MPNKQRVQSDEDLKRDWRAYKLANWIIDRVRAEETKRIRGVWYGRRDKDDFTILLAFPAKKHVPSYAAVRVDYKGKTVLDSIHNKERHDVLKFKPGNWERLLRRAFRKERDHV